MSSSVRASHTGLLFVMVCLAAPVAAHAQAPAEARIQDRKTEFDLPAQPLADALRAVGTRASVNVVFEPASVRGRSAPNLRGAYSVKEALDRLLDGSGLIVRVTSGGSFVIEGAARAAADTMVRLGLAEGGGGAHRKTAQTGVEDEMVVEDSRIKTFKDANVDIPRTINDAQPYYVFDARTISQSGATTIDDFLKQRLTMNTVAQTYQEMSGLNNVGSPTTIDLRGVGKNKTLILVNGRRLPGVTSNLTDGFEGQADLNGIALSSIERIEVLPSSASGIYGGGAIGGVVNVILKRDYSGGEVRATYDTMADVDAPRRNASFSYGMALEGGRTQVNVNGSWSDTKPYLLQERADLFRSNLNTLLRNSPTFINSGTWFGTTTNITGLGGNLVLKNNGTPLDIGSNISYVPRGTTPQTTAAQLAAGLLANAGQRNLDFPMSTQGPPGLLRPIGMAPATRSLNFNVERQMRPGFDLGLDLRYSDNRSEGIYNAASTGLFVNSTTPYTPFVGPVLVQLPDSSDLPIDTRYETMSATLEARMDLSRDWRGLASYTFSRNSSHNRYYAQDGNTAGINDGTINPFVDTLLFPQDFNKYAAPISYDGDNDLQDLEIRASGPLPSLPWGAPRLTAGVQYRVSNTPERTVLWDFPIGTANSNRVRYFERESRIGSLYAEASVPLVKMGAVPGLYSLDFQASGRSERFSVDTGTATETEYFKRMPVLVTYGGPTRNGLPFEDRSSYTATSSTFGFKYQPIPTVTLRASRATAFSPPTPGQLTVNPVQSTSTVSVNDPRNPPTAPPVPVYTLTGANGSLMPENSRSLNGGIIWEPKGGVLEGLRLNAEYYRTEQFDAIYSTLTAQTVVDLESSFPGRVTRNEAGVITLVDVSITNLFHRETEGMDFSADYSWKMPAGLFSVHAVQTTILHLKNQYSAIQPELDSVNRPAEGGAVKHKGNLVLTWEGQHWSMSWTGRYTGSYGQYQRSATNIPNTAYVLAQGGKTIPSQLYHDLMIGYRFDEASGGAAGLRGNMLSNLNVQLGVRNLFDTLPPVDAWYVTNFYLSPFGDSRMRSLWLSLRKGW